jgi:hypothetical protein
MPVFGRNSATPHDYESVLDEWLLTGVSLTRAMARNLMHDHRVTDERAKWFDGFVARPCSTAGLERALKQYQKKQVVEVTPPDFAVDTINGLNVLSGRSDGTHVINRDLQLATVLDLNLLTVPYEWARTQNKWDAFDNYDDAKPERFKEWLKSKLERVPPRPFIAAVLDMLSEYQQVEKPHHPTWATTWDAFAPYIKHPPERWPQVVGVDRPEGHWQIVLRYRVREAGSLARPTQLDAGWYAYHFPSPPQADVSVGGHPVDLVDPGASPLLPEFIHEQVPHRIEHWDAAREDGDPAIGQIAAAGSWTVADTRQRHLRRLVAAYGPGVMTWMPSSI